jgi:serine/threonine protein kinase
MSLTAGTRLGPYEIQSLLGAGGMGEVYLARDTRLQRTVAIKILPAHLSSNPDLRTRFEQEAKSISALQHPNICVIYDIGSQGGDTAGPATPWNRGGALPLQDCRAALDLLDFPLGAQLLSRYTASNHPRPRHVAAKLTD